MSSFSKITNYKVFVSSDIRPYQNLMFFDVCAWQGSSFCYRGHLNFLVYALHDMVARELEGSCVGQKAFSLKS